MDARRLRRTLWVVVAILAIALAPTRSAHSAPWARARSLPGSTTNEAQHARKTSDGGLVVVSRSDTATSNQAWITRYTPCGEVVWDRVFDGVTGALNLLGIAETADGGVAVAGNSGGSAWVTKLDAAGSVAWSRSLTASGVQARFVAGTPDGALTVVGLINVGGIQDIWAARLDAGGNLLWEKAFGGSSTEFVTAIAGYADGSIVITAETNSFGLGNDILVVKLDPSGGVVWANAYGTSSAENNSMQRIGDVATAPDGGAVFVTGSSISGGRIPWVVRLDSTGAIVWEYGYAGVFGGYGLGLASDGTIYFASRDSTLLGAVATRLNASGSVQWSTTYDPSFAYRAVALDDGVVLVGRRADPGGGGPTQTFLLRADAAGSAGACSGASAPALTASPINATTTPAALTITPLSLTVGTGSAVPVGTVPVENLDCGTEADCLCEGVICPVDDCHPGTCDPASGECLASPDGTPCQDGSRCTEGETCQIGLCGLPTSTVICTALDQCHVAGECFPPTGTCPNPPAPNGTACNDGNQCTQSDSCVSGACTGADPLTCPPGPCGPQACDPLTADCVDASPHTITGDATCDNQFAIYTALTEGSGMNVHYSGITGCHPGPYSISFTTTDRFLYIAAWSDNLAGQGLLHDLSVDGQPVISGSPRWSVTYTDTDMDVTFSCGSPLSLVASTMATTIPAPPGGWLDPAVGCANPPPGNVCYGLWGHYASIDLAAKRTWYDSGNQISANAPFQPGFNHREFLIFRLDMRDGTPCSDGNACTSNDRCDQAGDCAGTVIACDDGNPCTNDSCDPASGCVFTNNADLCSDGSACTVGDVCGGGACVPGSALNCNDGNPCTNDACNPATGCVHANNTAACNDGNACTLGDQCTNGACQPGPGTPNCNDNNVCTNDSCHPTSGCVHTNNTASCNDGNACTTGDVCVNGVCKGVLTGPFPCDWIRFTSTSVIVWTFADTNGVELIRGDLVQLRANQGHFYLTVLGCVANDTTVSSATDPTIPGVGAPAVLYYLARRSVPNDTWSDLSTSERAGAGGTRDQDLDGPPKAPGSCSSPP